MGKNGVLPQLDDMFGPGRHGPARRAGAADGLLAAPRVAAGPDRALRPARSSILDRRIHRPSRTTRRLQSHPGHPRRGPGAGRGVRGRDRRRHPLPRSRPLCSWAGLTPRHRESDTKVRRGSITKQGSQDGALGRSRGDQPQPRRRTRSKPTTVASPSGVVATSAASPRPARCSASSTTACVTARSVASRRPRRAEPARTQPADGSGIGMTSFGHGRQYVIEHCWLRRIAPCRTW